MAVLPNTGMESTPAGAANVQSIIDSNFQILDNLFDPDANHHDETPAASVTFDRNEGAIQEVSITADVTIAVSNMVVGKKMDIIIHTDAARTVTVPGAWTAAGTTTLATGAAGVLVITVWQTTGNGIVYMTNP